MSASPPRTAWTATSSSLKKLSSIGMPRSLVRSIAIRRLRLSTLAMSPKATRIGSDWAAAGPLQPSPPAASAATAARSVLRIGFMVLPPFFIVVVGRPRGPS